MTTQRAGVVQRQIHTARRGTWAALLVAAGGVMADAGPAAPSSEQLNARWADLASEDAAKAYRALWALVAVPGPATAFLKEHLRPAAPADAGRLARLIADLDADAYAARERAAKELEGFSELAEAALQNALKGHPSPEQRRFIEGLLAQIEAGRLSPPPARLREIRAVEVLERIGTPEAVKVLRGLAAGLPAARVTREAKVSLERLDKRPAKN